MTDGFFSDIPLLRVFIKYVIKMFKTKKSENMDKVKIYIQHYCCGAEDELITCSCRTVHGDCRECSMHRKSYIEEKEVTKDELFEMINNASDWIDISTLRFN